MSHELRTPLNSIIGFTGIILQKLVGPLNDEQVKQLTMVQDSAHHLLSLINDVLDLSKIEAGQLTMAAEAFDLRDAIHKAVGTVTPLARQKHLPISVQIAPAVGAITSDRRRVEQILLNLLNNAIKFTPAGQVALTCEADTQWITTRIQDTGIGIAPEDTDKLFRAFQQIETGLTRRFEGTGLGLSICKKLVELLGGEIHAHSAGTGQGATFTFTLPAGGKRQ
jgi:signal transduction histidine kinase